MRSWIQDPCVIDQQWTPVSIQQGTGGNWRSLAALPRQHDIIWAFFSDCIAIAAFAWTGCALVTRQHRSYRARKKTAAPRGRIRLSLVGVRRLLRFAAGASGCGCRRHRRRRPQSPPRSLRPPSQPQPASSPATAASSRRRTGVLEGGLSCVSTSIR